MAPITCGQVSMYGISIRRRVSTASLRNSAVSFFLKGINIQIRTTKKRTIFNLEIWANLPLSVFTHTHTIFFWSEIDHISMWILGLYWTTKHATQTVLTLKTQDATVHITAFSVIFIVCGVHIISGIYCDALSHKTSLYSQGASFIKLGTNKFI